MLPDEVVQEKDQYLFAPLFLGMLNEDSSQVRTAFSDAITVVVSRIPNIETVYAMVLKCFKDGTNDALQIGAAQVLSIIVTVEEDKFGKRIDDLTPLLLQYLSADVEWKLLYRTINIIEKMVKHTKKAQKPETINNLIRAVCRDEIVLHEHTWVRTSVNRLLGTYFSLRGNLEKSKGDVLLEPNFLYSLSKRLCKQFIVELSSNVADQLVKNLIFVIMHLHKMPSLYTGGSGKNPVEWLFIRLSNITKNIESIVVVCFCFSMFTIGIICIKDICCFIHCYGC